MRSQFPFPYDAVELLCPRCGSQYLHQGSVGVHHPYGADRTTVTHVDRGLVSSHILPNTETNMRSDRGGLLIGFYCENCRGVSRSHPDHDYAESLWLSITNVKGITELGWIVETPEGELVTRTPHTHDPAPWPTSPWPPAPDTDA